MTVPDPLVVAVIRSLMSRWIQDHYPDASDLELVQQFGQSAQPLADGLRAAIHDEVQRQLAARAQQATAVQG